MCVYYHVCVRAHTCVFVCILSCVCAHTQVFVCILLPLIILLLLLICFYLFVFPRTILAAAVKIDSGTISVSDLVLHSVGKFCMMFFVSAIIGVLFGLTCALVGFSVYLLFIFYLSFLKMFGNILLIHPLISDNTFLKILNR